MRLLDLSHPITSGMQVFPGDPCVQLHPALQLDTDGVAVSGIQLGSHTGTHLDAPSHTVANGRTTTDIALQELVGPALVIGLPDLAANQQISWGLIADQANGPLPPIVVIATGWDRHFGTQRYLQHPTLEPQAAQELIQRGMHVLALDTLNPDPTLQPDAAAMFPVHELVLGGDGLIIENLCGANQLPTRCDIGFFPLHLQHSDGAPVRAVAWV